MSTHDGEEAQVGERRRQNAVTPGAGRSVLANGKAYSGGRRKHVVVVDDIPTPYRIALFKAIQAIAPFRLSIVWLAARGREKLWNLNVEGSGLEVYAARDWQLFIPSVDRVI